MAGSTWHPGRFVWWELFTPDIAKSETFYSALLGWKLSPMELGPSKYNLILVGDRGMGGFVPLSSAMMEGLPPFWQAHLSVPDVDQSVAAARAAGGRILAEPVDMPPVGRFALVQDPQGAVLNVFTGGMGEPPAIDNPAPGMVCWTELYTTDLAGAAAFYEKVAGWKLASHPMQVFRCGERLAGGLMQAPPGMPPNWFNHLLVENLAATRAKAVELGGKVLQEEIPVPGIGRFSVILDNVGAGISLFEMDPGHK